MLELIQAVKRFEDGSRKATVLDHVNLNIGQGEMVALVGPSGSGKSTLLNILGCLDDLTAGEYLVNGQRATGLSAREAARVRNENFGFVFQFFGLISEYTAVENVMVPLLYRGEADRGARRKALRMLDRLGIGELADQRPDRLSGGQQQRVAIARALVGEAPVLLADEPTGSLDSATGAEVLKLLEERHQAGQTVIVVTHAPDVAERCQRVIQVRDGQLSEVR